jgi:hypothetical protein
VKKFAENIVLRLTSHEEDKVVVNTRDHSSYRRENSGVYDAVLMRDLKKKGKPIPDSVSTYIRRWIQWVNSNHEEKNQILYSFYTALRAGS